MTTLIEPNHKLEATEGALAYPPETHHSLRELRPPALVAVDPIVIIDAAL